MKGFDFSVNSKVSRISQQYSKDTNISIEDAMKLLFTSKTYQALIECFKRFRKWIY